MKQIFAAALLIISLATTPAADPQSDADYIVSQTVTRDLFNGTLVAQRPVILSAIQHDLKTRGITLTDPDRFFDLFMSEFIDEFTASMQAQTSAIYLRNFSAEELSEIAAFYKTDAGQALIATTPTLMAEGARLGQQAGMQAGLNANKRLAARIKQENLILVDDPGMMSRLMDMLK
ncbi:MAG: DUF2059 domain-containing protein [Pelagimonas sp.]|jgi:hypothetical protein|nr:DUF2059 domain-containing protein [Pelagimonas sp.]